LCRVILERGFSSLIVVGLEFHVEVLLGTVVVTDSANVAVRLHLVIIIIMVVVVVVELGDKSAPAALDGADVFDEIEG